MENQIPNWFERIDIVPSKGGQLTEEIPYQ